jgi:small subunit ribosomal protein S17e
MGRIKTRDIKRLGIQLVEKYRDKFTTDFETNKQILKDFKIEGKRFRNKLAGYITHIMKIRSEK